MQHPTGHNTHIKYKTGILKKPDNVLNGFGHYKFMPLITHVICQYNTPQDIHTLDMMKNLITYESVQI